jgi:hypothetical protein
MRISEIAASVSEKASKAPAFPKPKPQPKPKRRKRTKPKRYRPQSGPMFKPYPPKYPPGQ